MFVTRHTHVVDSVLADKLWRLYDIADGGLSEQAVTCEILYRTEFDATIADPTNRLWMARLAKAVSAEVPVRHLEMQHYIAVDFSMVMDEDATRPLELPLAMRR